MLLKEKLKHEVCYGTFLKIPRPEIVEILALSGYDFIICDMEHAQINEQEAREVIKTATSLGLAVTVRLPEADQGLVNRLLEVGATGIQIPRLKKAEEINTLASYLHYPPYGTRSVGNANLQAGYGTVPLKDYLDSQNEKVLAIGQFETKEIQQPVEAIFEQLDVAFIGPVDLSVDFGQIGNFGHPDIQQRLTLIEQTAAKTNTVLGAFAATPDQAQEYIRRGYRYIALSGDASMLMSSAKNILTQLKTLEGNEAHVR